MSNREDGTPLERVEERRFRLGAYATGNYMCQCIRCNEGFIGDKRALSCLPCAAEDAAAQLAYLQSERDELQAEVERKDRALHRIVHGVVGTLDPAGDGGTYILTGHEYQQCRAIARQALNPDGTGGGR